MGDRFPYLILTALSKAFLSLRRLADAEEVISDYLIGQEKLVGPWQYNSLEAYWQKSKIVILVGEAEQLARHVVKGFDRKT